MNKKGFTLIELLVVIAIIGLLSTLAVVSLSSARAKARDAQRLSDVKQLSSLIETEEANGPSSYITCGGASTTNSLTASCTAPGEVSQFSRFLDPVAATRGTQCADGSTDTCGYAIRRFSNADATVKTNNYSICFYLEAASNLGATAGSYSVFTGGGTSATCSTI